MRRALVVALVALASCREARAPRRILPRTAPALEAPVAAPAEPTALQRIHGHAPGDAGIAPSPDPRAGPLLGWDFAPFDDGFGRDDVGWLVLTERRPDGSRRDLVNVGARAQCREIAPPMLRGVGDAGLVGAVRSVRCELPEGAEFHLLRATNGGWTVARAGCTHPSRACPSGADGDRVVGSVNVPAGGLAARLAGAFERRGSGPSVPAEEALRPARSVALRLEPREPIADGTGLDARNLVLFAAGQRVDFGAVVRCQAPAASERRAHPFLNGALLAVVCDTPDEGRRPIAVGRAGDVITVRTVAAEGGAAIVTRRVGLLSGSTVTVER